MFCIVFSTDLAFCFPFWYLSSSPIYASTKRVVVLCHNKTYDFFCTCPIVFLGLITRKIRRYINLKNMSHHLPGNPQCHCCLSPRPQLLSMRHPSGHEDARWPEFHEFTVHGYFIPKMVVFVRPNPLHLVKRHTTFLPQELSAVGRHLFSIAPHSPACIFTQTPTTPDLGLEYLSHSPNNHQPSAHITSAGSL